MKKKTNQTKKTPEQIRAELIERGLVTPAPPEFKTRGGQKLSLKGAAILAAAMVLAAPVLEDPLAQEIFGGVPCDTD